MSPELTSTDNGCDGSDSSDHSRDEDRTRTENGDHPAAGLVTPPRSARLVLVCGLLAGLLGVLTTPFLSPEQFMLASDVYYYAAESLLDGGDIYEVAPPDRPGFYYIYPPVVIFVFVLHALTGSPVGAYLLQTALNLCFAAGIAVLCWRALSRRGVSLSRLDGALLFGFALLSAYSSISVVNGQVNIGLGFAIALGLDALDRNRGDRAGIVFALAALVKVFPAVLGLWLLRRRAYRGVGLAVAVGVTGLLLGLLALGPDVTTTYLGDVLTGRYDGFDGSPNPGQTRGGARRQVAALLGIGPPLVTPIAALVLAPVVGYLYLNVESDLQRLATALGTILATLLFLPLQRLYMVLFAFPLVVLLYRLPGGRSRLLLIAGALVSFVRTEFSLVRDTLTSLPLGGVTTPLVGTVERLFEVILPPTLGMWLLLGACVLIHYEERHR